MSRVGVSFDDRGEVVDYELKCSDADAARGWRALMLAPRGEICRALLRGESVPVGELSAEWVRRFGRHP